MLRPGRVGHKALMAVVCPSVCPVPDLSREWKEARETGDP